MFITGRGMFQSSERVEKRIDIKGWCLAELERFIKEKGYRHFYARQIFGWLYKKRVEDFGAMTDISQSARRFFEQTFYFSSLKLLKREKSKDLTEKFIFNLEDGNRIETVLIPEEKRMTLCLSTQVGCKFGCKFCVSGLSGFVRNLTASEIVNQYLQVSDLIKPTRITNIVFMGIGEPLDNFSNVIKSVMILTNPYGVYIGRRKVCISTIGIVPRVQELAELNLGIKLAISLHTADESLRRKIIPVAKHYSLADLIKAAKKFCQGNKFPLTFEYVMIHNLNTHKEDALKLVKLLKDMNCKINLIPYNPSSYFSWQPPFEDEIEIFKSVLRKHQLLFTLRRPRGQDIKASCGQLRAELREV